MDTKALALITARGASKRIPRKNIKDFLGKPIIAYSIEAALEAGCFSEVMVSTDDPEIAALAKARGAQVPFMRSAAASGDFATTAEAVLEVLGRYSQAGRSFEYACCLYPTAPFATPEKLRQGFDLLRKSGASSVVPVVRFSYPIQRALKIEDGVLAMMRPENLNSRSQDLPPAYHDAGQFYWLRVPAFLEEKSLFGRKAAALVVPETEVQDIDTEEDWRIAQMKFQMMRGA